MPEMLNNSNDSFTGKWFKNRQQINHITRSHNILGFEQDNLVYISINDAGKLTGIRILIGWQHYNDT